ncbi:hypothetical protein [Prosthecobacter sp.]|jgi:hypothetical protein|uniref:hypothetical protein n=1 Tax=Prosthecobacter sp. TaxID=1965333 RepID=UPI003783D584
MKTNTTLTASQNEEITLGWTLMPAYGEVMNKMAGASHTSVTSTLKLAHKSTLTSFWSTLSNLK